MKDERARVFMACATGGGLGTLLAMQMGWFWGVGVLVGGLTSYIFYDPAGAWKAPKTAWQNRPDRAEWLQRLKNGVTIALVAAPIFVLSLVVLIGGDVPIIGLIILSLIMTLWFTVGVCGMVDGMMDFPGQDKLYNGILKYANPFMLYIYWPLWCLWKLPGALWLVMNFVAGFMKSAFILMHSDIRLLCGIDGLIGACVGFAAGNALVGALVGGAVGFLNYEFVSKRWLHLVPAPAKKN